MFRMNGWQCLKAVLNLKKYIRIGFLIVAAIFIIVMAINSIAVSVSTQIEQETQGKLITDTAYNDAVEPYRITVTKYCQAYSITEYIDVVMKMLSIYSATHTTDILNSSFSYLNTKYEHKNEGITNPDYSIHIGVMQISE